MPPSGYPALTDQDREKLVRCLRLLSSDHVGEVAAAGAAAHRIVSGLSLDWADIVAPSPPLVVKPDPPKQAGWRDDLAVCLAYSERLTPWETGFLRNLEQRRLPSLTQLAVLSGASSRGCADER